MARKKKRNLSPRRKRFDRQRRLDSARSVWSGVFAAAVAADKSGRRLVHRYASHFGVNLECAVVELRLLGVRLDPTYVAALLASLADQCRVRDERKAQRLEEVWSDSNDTFAFIVGYTPGGAPYGVTWEEVGGREAYRAAIHSGSQIPYLG